MTQTPLLSDLDKVAERLAHAESIVLCLDFDGTLAPIVEHPDQVRLVPEAARLLRRLAETGDVRLAIISGRAREDLQQRVGIPGLVYAGNHGLEISGPGLLYVDELAVASRPALRALATALAATLQNLRGAWVEDKTLTLSVHFRQVAEPQHENVRRAVHEVLAGASHPFHLSTGNKVFDIRPRTDWHKGRAVRWLLEGLKRPNPLVIYIGDDTTDEDAFGCLTEHLTVKVGSPDSTAARYFVEDCREVQVFLQWLGDHVVSSAKPDRRAS